MDRGAGRTDERMERVVGGDVDCVRRLRRLSITRRWRCIQCSCLGWWGVVIGLCVGVDEWCDIIPQCPSHLPHHHHTSTPPITIIFETTIHSVHPVRLSTLHSSSLSPFFIRCSFITRSSSNLFHPLPSSSILFHPLPSSSILFHPYPTIPLVLPFVQMSSSTSTSSSSSSTPPPPQPTAQWSSHNWNTTFNSTLVHKWPKWDNRT